MKLLDKIKSNGKTSPSATGKIVGIILGSVYRNTFTRPEWDLYAWYDADPDWQDKPVYLVEKDLPEIPLFKDKILELKEAGYDVEANYDSKKRVLVWYPGCEVEPHDWIEELESQI